LTWAALTTTGRGEVSYRLEIERLPTEFVTHASMETATRKPWLRISGKLKCLSNPVSGEVEVSGLQATIVDKDGGATAIFAKAPDATTWLTAAFSAAATSASVRSTSGFVVPGWFWMDSEAVKYSAVTATGFTGCVRGAYGSLTQAHYIETLGASRWPEVTSSLTSIAGCRARLYAYGQNDSPQGNGTQIWLGVVTKHPTLQGSAWSVMIDPITSVLNKTLSADLEEPSTARGIYYHWHSGLTIIFRRTDTSEIIDATLGLTTRFFEDNAEFVSHLNGLLDTAVTAAGWDAAFSCSIRAIESDSSWYLGITTDATVRVIVTRTGSRVDPIFIGDPTDINGDLVVPTSGVETYWLGGPDSPEGAGSVPRGSFGASDVGVGGPVTAADTFPINRIFISGAALSSNTDSVAIKWKAFGGQDEAEVVASILSFNGTTNSVDLALDAFPPGFEGPLLSGFAWTAPSAPEFRFGRTLVRSGNVYQFLFKITTLAPLLLNRGAVPDVRLDDLDYLTWQVLSDGTQPRIVSGRRFTSYSTQELIEVVKNELLLAGFMLGCNASGQIAISRIRGISRTEHPDLVVDAALDVPTWEPTAYGMVNQVSVQRGYSELEDEYRAPRVLVRDVAEFGRNPRPRTASISPKSVPAGAMESFGECVEVSQRIFSAFAGPYAVITARVPMSAYDVATVGAVVSLTSPHIPDHETGTRGVSGLRCVVTGREIDLAKGEITLRMYATTRQTSGYAPSGLVDAATNVSGNTWDVDIDTSLLPTGTTAAEWWAIGDLVYALQWDTTVDTRIQGSVASVTVNKIRVTFGASAADLLVNTYYITSQLSSAAISAEQARYAFFGDATMQVAFVAGDSPARRLA